MINIISWGIILHSREDLWLFVVIFFLKNDFIYLFNLLLLNVIMCKCSICLEEISKRPCDTLWLPCSHTFHKKCILPWISKNTYCPLCREDFIKNCLLKNDRILIRFTNIKNWCKGIVVKITNREINIKFENLICRYTSKDILCSSFITDNNTWNGLNLNNNDFSSAPISFINARKKNRRRKRKQRERRKKKRIDEMLYSII